jgi:hypothetical protein
MKETRFAVNLVSRFSKFRTHQSQPGAQMIGGIGGFG